MKFIQIHCVHPGSHPMTVSVDEVAAFWPEIDSALESYSGITLKKGGRLMVRESYELLDTIIRLNTYDDEKRT